MLKTVCFYWNSLCFGIKITSNEIHIKEAGQRRVGIARLHESSLSWSTNFLKQHRIECQHLITI